MKKPWIGQGLLMAAAVLLCLGSSAWARTPQGQLALQKELGELLYFDEYLSRNRNQSCAGYHFPAPGFVDPDNVADPGSSVVSLGSDPGLNGGRNAPSGWPMPPSVPLLLG
jgi:cytochrome c peroxidase